MSQRRYTASDITDDALDALYANASKGWRRGDRWKERALTAETALSDVLRIVSEWVIEANDYGGVDADDLTFRLEQAGHKLPEESTTP